MLWVVWLKKQKAMLKAVCQKKLKVMPKVA